jgi:uncharacterized protein YycO
MSQIPQHLVGQYAVLLYRGTSIISKLIRWQTRGKVSHAALLTPSGQIIESREGNGVQVIDGNSVDWSIIEAYGIIGMSEEGWAATYSGMLSEVGSGYDYWAVIRFISRSRMPDNHKWFCSELLFDKVKKHGKVALLERIEASEVSPQAIRTSPLIYPKTP